MDRVHHDRPMALHRFKCSHVALLYRGVPEGADHRALNMTPVEAAVEATRGARFSLRASRARLIVGPIITGGALKKGSDPVNYG